MGPSGSGKTTLLNALAGQVPQSQRLQLAGSITVNGVPATEANHRQAYVEQDNQFYSMLTVDETLETASQLQLPAHMSEQQGRAYVDQLVAILGLAKVGGGGGQGGPRRHVCLLTNMPLWSQPLTCMGCCGNVGCCPAGAGHGGGGRQDARAVGRGAQAPGHRLRAHQLPLPGVPGRGGDRLPVVPCCIVPCCVGLPVPGGAALLSTYVATHPAATRTALTSTPACRWLLPAAHHGSGLLPGGEGTPGQDWARDCGRTACCNCLLRHVSAHHSLCPRRAPGLQVVSTLKQLAAAGHTVVTSIHQPRSSIFASERHGRAGQAGGRLGTVPPLPGPSQGGAPAMPVCIPPARVWRQS